METAEESRQVTVEQESPQKEDTQWTTGSFHLSEGQEDQGKNSLNSDDYQNDQEMRQRLPKGYKMMSNMGYKVGDALGSAEPSDYNSGTRLKRPLQPHDNVPKAKRRSKSSNGKQDLEEEYRQLNSNRQGDKRKMDIWRHMQKIAFEMSGDADVCLPDSDPRDFNILWRPYVREINHWERPEPLVEEPADDEPNNDDETSSNDDNINTDTNNSNGNNQETQDRSIEIESMPEDCSDCEDEELNLLYEMGIDERIIKLHIFLRCELYYCYYCGIQFEDERDLHANCPGLTEEEH
ncbi:ZYRO0D14168p [Zygosaccharomyces rouxii]|uniref:ZYRO0D14168p n=1 Tax=Zygosaccharomyces rouxii (strain ATCC 2623 / CBS 732 / NBRC 1130 / NCYC 568 / NRRL Y-229) TaxID=559307 RepID=C5DWE5_ZYGRC|nr:uncharacterized protein ZYRO0D14168g [Zygosaccharomyces rouxii]KAH9201025.1 hypothetical protein LQ764DRAFT_102846 [Zygosaccharomyces rouxii]CAR28114.1 ZYRO0D14168p [Zygosaccharomyces rouxii]